MIICFKCVSLCSVNYKLCKMKIWLLVLFFFCDLFCKVRAKAVDSSKHISFTGQHDSLSIHLASQIHPKSEETDMKYFRNIAISMTGKPLYFVPDSVHKSETLKNEAYEGPLPDKYELSKYENLERMFDTEIGFQDTNKFEEFEHPHGKVETKIHNDGNVFKEDQVFLHKNKMKREKSEHNNERDATKPSKKSSLKSTDVGQPCETARDIDYKNKSADELASSINVHSMIYGNQYEQQFKSSIHETISEDFHQYETEIIHKNVDQVHTESSVVSETRDLGSFEESFESLNQIDDHVVKKSDKLNPENKASVENNDPEDLKRSSSNSQPIKVEMPMKLDSQNTNIEAVDSPSKTNDDKHLLKMEASHISDSNFRSFVFNPNAQPQEVFQDCKTPKNESGRCRYIQHCMLPSILSSIRHFMDNVCIIEEQYIGVCCPEFPVHAVLVNWPNSQDDFNSNDDTDTVEVPEDCGVGNNRRIVGGLDADRKAWPWMVALLNNEKKFFCGGSLINSRYVLTAAHCTFGPSSNQIVARLGEYDFNDPREPHDDYSVIEIKRHGQYARFTLRNDIAVLKLERPVVFNEFVRTICLPDTGKDYLGKPATLAGWGHLNGDSSTRRSNVLQEASFPIIGNDECGVTHGVPVATSIICASAPSKDKGACNGDSGGPLMLLDSDERWKVIGIVSWGRRGCNPKFPTAYSRVTHYLDWIKEHTT